MADCSELIAIVAGASRGVGRGVALGLGEAGATVYVTGRTIQPRADVPGTISQTAEEVTQAGGTGIALPCDHREEAEVAAAFGRVLCEQGRVDILVNAVWGGYEEMFENGEFTWPAPFWKQPLRRWDAMFDAGVRAAYVASMHAARAMVERRRGLIVNISFWAARKFMGNTAYGVAKAATDKMTADTAHELCGYNVAVVSLYPGLVRTERVMQAAGAFDLSNSESPQFAGRAVAALARDPEVLRRTGQVLVAAELAKEYGFTDIDGKRPRPLSLEQL